MHSNRCQRGLKTYPPFGDKNDAPRVSIWGFSLGFSDIFSGIGAGHDGRVVECNVEETLVVASGATSDDLLVRSRSQAMALKRHAI